MSWGVEHDGPPAPGERGQASSGSSFTVTFSETPLNPVFSDFDVEGRPSVSCPLGLGLVLELPGHLWGLLV